MPNHPVRQACINNSIVTQSNPGVYLLLSLVLVSKVFFSNIFESGIKFESSIYLYFANYNICVYT